MADGDIVMNTVGPTKRRKTPSASQSHGAAGTSLLATTTTISTASSPIVGGSSSSTHGATSNNGASGGGGSHSFSGTFGNGVASSSLPTKSSSNNHHHRSHGKSKHSTATTTKAKVTSSVDLSNRVMDDLHKEQALLRATVRRRWFGTGPFDYIWLNLDICGLLCAAFTYFLHLYSIYAVTFILLPPWMSITVTENDDGKTGGVSVRHMSFIGLFHQALFVSIGFLAIYSHFKAMITDPGAVPPDAKPLPLPEEEEELALQDPELNNTNNTGATGASNDFGGSSGNDDKGEGVSGGGDGLLETVPLTARAASVNQHRNLRLCRRCRAFKPPRAHHCSICKRCIIKMDHHCPWVNNCVALGNHKYFLLFVFYTFINCTYSMLLVIYRFSSCVHSSRSMHYHHRHYHSHRGGAMDFQEAAAAAAVDASEQTHRPMCVDHPSQLLTILLLLVESLLFGIFTSCMMFDQMEVVQNKMTHIDRLKGLEVGGSLSGVAEVFGLSQNETNKKGLRRNNASRFRPDWLSPFVHGACFPASIRDEVMGFCTAAANSCCNNNINNNTKGTAAANQNTTADVPDIV
ncbi:hypothetical protein ACA910_014636 [Epithemia clementina (nom. ined.)]